MAPELALLALGIELILGYPGWLFARIGHPVTWIGALIRAVEARLNAGSLTAARRRQAGVGLVGLLLLASAVVGLPLQGLVALGLPALLLVALAASSLLAQRSLAQHVAEVASALERSGLAGGRVAVAQIVGRDPERLDEAGVCRAAIESLAENFSDAVTAPAFWLAVAGLPGAIAYKAINTADSMVGHKTPRYLDFGWASARLDDLVNLPVSRLSGLLIVLAASLSPGLSAGNAWRAVRRDASGHRSPNAGWPEAAIAGAMGISLAGPRYYDGHLTEDTEMNRGGRRDLSPADIRKALRLYWVADALLIALLAGIVALSALI